MAGILPRPFGPSRKACLRSARANRLSGNRLARDRCECPRALHYIGRLPVTTPRCRFPQAPRSMSPMSFPDNKFDGPWWPRHRASGSRFHLNTRPGARMLQLRRLVTVAGILALLAGPLAAQVADVQVTPENLSIRVGERKSLYAAAFDRAGNVIPTARFTYRSSAPGIATVDAEGSVVGRAAGSAAIEVRAGTRTISVPVTVSGAGGSAPGGASGGAMAPNNTSRI